MATNRAAQERALREQLDRIWYRQATRSALQDEQCAPLDAAGRVLLRAMANYGPLRSSVLADTCSMSRPAVSRRVTALLEAGYVQCGPDPEDRRAALLTVSERGFRTLESIEVSGAQALSSVVADFDDSDLTTLSGLLRRLNDRADVTVAAAPDNRSDVGAPLLTQ